MAKIDGPSDRTRSNPRVPGPAAAAPTKGGPKARAPRSGGARSEAGKGDSAHEYEGHLAPHRQPAGAGRKGEAAARAPLDAVDSPRAHATPAARLKAEIKQEVARRELGASLQLGLREKQARASTWKSGSEAHLERAQAHVEAARMIAHSDAAGAAAPAGGHAPAPHGQAATLDRRVHELNQTVHLLERHLGGLGRAQALENLTHREMGDLHGTLTALPNKLKALMQRLQAEQEARFAPGAAADSSAAGRARLHTIEHHQQELARLIPVQEGVRAGSTRHLAQPSPAAPTAPPAAPARRGAPSPGATLSDQLGAEHARRQRGQALRHDPRLAPEDRAGLDGLSHREVGGLAETLAQLPARLASARARLDQAHQRMMGAAEPSAGSVGEVFAGRQQVMQLMGSIEAVRRVLDRLQAGGAGGPA